ncbi:MAG: hypothetical protein C1943_09490 [Halochromatium sp.]|nr:hypothetical protein [Halochromatium sp.]
MAVGRGLFQICHYGLALGIAVSELRIGADIGLELNRLSRGSEDLVYLRCRDEAFLFRRFNGQASTRLETADHSCPDPKPGANSPATKHTNNTAKDESKQDK